MTVYTPDPPPPRQPHLRASEHAWLSARRAEAVRTDPDPPKASQLPRLMRTACDRLSVEAGWTALGLERGTATIPPPARRRLGQRRGSGPSDPTSAVTTSMLDTLASVAYRWAHLIDVCPDDGRIVTVAEEQVVHRCEPPTIVQAADLLAADLPDTPPADVLVDGLLGTPPSSPAAWTALVGTTATWVSKAAGLLGDAFTVAWRDGAEEDVLRDGVRHTQQLARRAASVAGQLAMWSGRTEATCKHGCGRLPEARRRECGPCRNTNPRERA